MLYRIFLYVLLSFSLSIGAEDEPFKKFPGKLIISPNLFNVEIGNKPVNESLIISNAGSEIVQLKVYARSWELDETNEVIEIPTTEQSLERWMVINPTKIELDPGETQVVRFSIRPKIELDPGEHRSMIYLEEQAPQGAEEQAGIHLVGIFGIAIYGQVGKAIRTGILHDATYFDDENGFGMNVDIESTGNANVRFNGNYVIIKQADDAEHGKKIVKKLKKFETGETTDIVNDITDLDAVIISGGSVARLPVLPQTRRMIPLYMEKPTEKGEYVILMVGKLGDDKKSGIIEKTIPFTVEQSLVVNKEESIGSN